MWHLSLLGFLYSSRHQQGFTGLGPGIGGTQRCNANLHHYLCFSTFEFRTAAIEKVGQRTSKDKTILATEVARKHPRSGGYKAEEEENSCHDTAK